MRTSALARVMVQVVSCSVSCLGSCGTGACGRSRGRCEADVEPRCAQSYARSSVGVCRAGATRCDAVALQALRGTRAASWTGTRLLSRARSTRTSGTAASAAPVHGRLGCGPIGSTWSTNSAEYLTGSRCERAFCGRGDGRSHRACALCSTRAAAQEPVPRRPLPMAHHRHCWHRHSTAATGWVGTHTLAGVCRRTQDSAGTARAHLPADLPVAARPSSTLTRGTLVPLNLGRLDRAGGNLEYSAGRDAHCCTGCAIATLTLVGCTAAREQRGNTTHVPAT